MRYVSIDLSSDNHLQQPKIFGGYSGEHNETVLQVKLPSRMIGIECSGYRFDFQTSEDNKISSPLIPISELNDDVLSFHLVEQLTIAGNLLFNVVAILSNETTVSLVSKTNTVVLCIEDSPEGNVQLADPNGYKDELQKMIDERILEINPAKVDQTYNPKSPNAQSGIAISEVLNNFDIKGYKMLSITHIQSIIGDVNLDGEITLKDKTLIDYYADGTLTKSPNVLIADVNQDGIVDNTDGQIIRDYILTGETSNTRIGQIVDEIKIELDDAKFEESNRAINNYTVNDVVVFQRSELEFEYETYAISSLTTNDLGNTIITIAPYSITDNKFTGESVPAEIALNNNENYEYWLWVRDKSSGESVLKIQDISLSHNAKERLLNTVSFEDFAGKNGKPGVVYANQVFGIGINLENGNLYLRPAVPEEIDNKSELYAAIVPQYLDYAVKKGITENKEKLTESEKKAALDWLGVSAEIGDINTALDKIIEIQNHYISLGEQ